VIVFLSLLLAQKIIVALKTLWASSRTTALVLDRKPDLHMVTMWSDVRTFLSVELLENYRFTCQQLIALLLKVCQSHSKQFLVDQLPQQLKLAASQ